VHSDISGDHLAPSSRVKYSKNNAKNRWKCSYVGDGVGSDCSQRKQARPSGWSVRNAQKRKGGTTVTLKHQVTSVQFFLHTN
jgi:hypothetical protein